MRTYAYTPICVEQIHAAYGLNERMLKLTLNLANQVQAIRALFVRSFCLPWQYPCVFRSFYSIDDTEMHEMSSLGIVSPLFSLLPVAFHRIESFDGAAA